ncbi:hypothetical protein ACUY1T_02700 [Billgrantia sp. Q4P2]|uniref:hypothetical protein n=1 Tax=Billgrantia sp. Q4P2 TaxID=3463857 RepID=UPI0040568FD5
MKLHKARAYWGVGLKILLFAAIGYAMGLFAVTGLEMLISALMGRGAELLLAERDGRLLAALVFVPYWLAVGAKGVREELDALPR